MHSSTLGKVDIHFTDLKTFNMFFMAVCQCQQFNVTRKLNKDETNKRVLINTYIKSFIIILHAVLLVLKRSHLSAGSAK